MEGENVEPAELEEAAMKSSTIQQIVVVGQVNYWFHSTFDRSNSIINFLLGRYKMNEFTYC
jgi:hypothetical protein